jgi:hypothetical protein
MTMTSTTLSVSGAAPRPLTFVDSAPYFVGLFLLALVAFWPSYLSTPATATGYMHFHALTATMWMVMLIVQPLAIRRRHIGRHRAIGRVSCVVAPLVVSEMVLLTHSRTPDVPRADLPTRWRRGRRSCDGCRAAADVTASARDVFTEHGGRR